MRITDIRCWLVESNHPPYPFRWRAGLAGSGDGTPAHKRPLKAVLRMDTDEDVFGAVEVTQAPAGLPSLVERRFKALIGENPLNTEKLWHLIWEIDRIEELPMAHLGLIDQLAWDIKSKRAGLPLYQLLGGFDPEVPAYASTVTWDTMGEYERHIKHCIDVGFKAFKLHAWGDAREDAKLSRNLRKWAGPDADLMFDGSAGWDYVTSLWFGRVLQDEGFLWYEEPMREFELGSYVKLCEKLDIPILAAETSDGCHWNMASWIQAKALDMTRASSFYKGGITGAIKIAHLSDAHGMRAQVHGMGLANAQLCAAIRNNDYYEQLVMSTEQIDGLTELGPLAIKGGMLTVSGAPGLGHAIDWKAVERHAVARV
ncbi:MAG: racemase [Alphaproteobacteria bacterium]|nr:racemase [Alphaproteobacteria bacterium]